MVGIRTTVSGGIRTIVSGGIRTIVSGGIRTILGRTGVGEQLEECAEHQATRVAAAKNQDGDKIGFEIGPGAARMFPMTDCTKDRNKIYCWAKSKALQTAWWLQCGTHRLYRTVGETEASCETQRNALATICHQPSLAHDLPPTIPGP